MPTLVSSNALGWRTPHADNAAKQKTATINVLGYRSGYLFDQQGRLIHTQDANGGFVTNVFDSAGHLAAVLNQLGERARQYGYDLAGRVVTYTDAANRLKTYSFDAAGQNTATQFADGTIATNMYDRVGRRTTMIDWGGTSTYSFDALGRQSGQTDAAGFIQAYQYGQALTMVYDEENRMTRLDSGAQVSTYAYDGDNLKRLEIALSGATTTII